MTNDDLPEIAGRLKASFDAADAGRFRPRYNLAPTDQHWLLVADPGGARRIVPAVWGLPVGKRPAINVRAESLAKGAFRNHRRGLAIVDGFYEWRAAESRRKGRPARAPFWFHAPDRGLLLLATVDTPLGGSARAANAFAIVTVASGPDVAPFHDRAPAIIPAARADEWLCGAGAELLTPAAAGTLAATPVSLRVNRVEHDDPDCLAPPEPEPPGRQLDLLHR